MFRVHEKLWKLEQNSRETIYIRLICRVNGNKKVFNETPLINSEIHGNAALSGDVGKCKRTPVER